MADSEQAQAERLEQFRRLQQFRKMQGETPEADPANGAEIRADTLPRRAKAFGENAVSSVVGTAGGVMGGLVGGAGGHPVAGAVAGATAGGALGSAAVQSAKTGSIDLPRTGLDAALEGISEFGGRLIPGSKQAAKHMLLGKAVTGIAAAEETFRGLAKQMEGELLKAGNDPVAVRQFVNEMAFTASQMSESEVLKFVENFSRGSIFTGKGLRAVDTLQTRVLQNIPDLVAARVGPAMDVGQLGNLLVERVKTMKAVGKRQMSTAYHAVDERMAVAYHDSINPYGPQRAMAPGAFSAELPTATPTARPAGPSGSSIPKERPASVEWSEQFGLRGEPKFIPSERYSVPGPFSGKIGGGKPAGPGMPMKGGTGVPKEAKPGQVPFVRSAANEVGGRVGIIDLNDANGLFSAQRALRDKLGGKMPDPEGVQVFVNMAENIAGTENLSFAEVKELRTQVREKIDSAVTFDASGRSTTAKPSFAAAGEKLYDYLTAKMRGAAVEVDKAYENQSKNIMAAFSRGEVPETALLRPRVPTVKLIDDAEEFAKNGYYGGINDQVFRGIVKAADAKGFTAPVIKQLLPDGDPINSRFVRDRLGGQSPEWMAVRQAHIHRIFKESGADMATLRKALMSPNSPYGLENIRVIHGDANLSMYRRVVDSLDKLSRGTSREGSIVPRLIESGVIGGTAMSIPTALVNPAVRKTAMRGVAATGLYLISARTMSKWLTNPNRLKDFVTLVEASPGSKLATGAALRLMGTLAKDEYIEIPPNMSPEEYRQGLNGLRQANQ